MSQQDNFFKQKMTNGKFFSLLAITLVATILIFSLVLFVYISSLDKNVLRAEPYLEKVSYDDLFLRDLALRYSADCLADDKSCIVNAIYRGVVSGQKYISDPNGTELIRSPENTLLNGGGDCEDLAILVDSLLNTLNIPNYLVLTKNHAYALACGVDANKIREYGQASLKEVYANKIENETNLGVSIVNGEILISNPQNKNFKLDSHEAVFIQSGKKDGFMNLKYDFVSKDNFDFYVVLSKNDFDDFIAGKSFNYVKACTREKGSCDNLPASAGVIIYNPKNPNIEVFSSIDFIYQYDSAKLFVNNSLSFYEIKIDTCVVLETTAGEYGFVGLASEDLVGEKLAFNPKTKEYFILS